MLNVNKVNKISANYMCNQEFKHRNETARYCHKMTQQCEKSRELLETPTGRTPSDTLSPNIMSITLLSLVDSRPMGSVIYPTVTVRQSTSI